MSDRLRLLHEDQRGLTLVELLIAIVLAGIVTAGITMTVGHLFTASTRTSYHMTAVRQVQSAGYWVSKDTLQAQPSKVDPSGGDFLVLGWTDWGGLENEVVYTIEDGKLKRRHTVGDEAPTVSFVAHHIVPGETTFVPSGSAFIFTVTANVSGQEETRKYEVKPRPD
ncbi:MAG: prepilin-type N-terminal cleavage/methylation domain-containing protein [Dehalococcoidia bacterium]